MGLIEILAFLVFLDLESLLKICMLEVMPQGLQICLDSTKKRDNLLNSMHIIYIHKAHLICLFLQEIEVFLALGQTFRFVKKSNHSIDRSSGLFIKDS